MCLYLRKNAKNRHSGGFKMLQEREREKKCENFYSHNFHAAVYYYAVLFVFEWISHNGTFFTLQMNIIDYGI